MVGAADAWDFDLNSIYIFFLSWGGVKRGMDGSD